MLLYTYTDTYRKYRIIYKVRAQLQSQAPIYACPKSTKCPVCFENVKHVWNLGQVLENFGPQKHQ